MLNALRALNNITAQRILYTCYGILSNNFWYQTTSNFDKLLEQKDNENTAKITILIFITIKMHIKSTKLLDDSAATVNYESEEKLYKWFKGLDWDNRKEVDKVVDVAKNNEDKAKDLREKISGKREPNWKERRCIKSVYQISKKLT